MNPARKALFTGGGAAAALALTLSFAAADPADETPAEPAAVTAVAVASDAAAPAQPAPAEAPALTVVPNHEVCMVNDRFFARKLIPVEVEGKTYYGCCAACKDRLAQDRTVRYAADPVSGDEVDKATAVIAAAPDDTVLYFASEESLQKYLAERR